MVGAVLTQQTSWKSVERALQNLRSRGLLALDTLAGASVEVLEECMRPASFYRVKARRVRAMARSIVQNHGSLDDFLSMEPQQLRESLLRMAGVGFETADSILLYAAGLPFMVVDAYTRRIMQRLGNPLPRHYEEARRSLEETLPLSVHDYQEFHALLVELGKRYCRPKPLCGPCPLQDRCPHGQMVAGGNG